MLLLSLSLKFIPTPNDTTDTEILQSFDEYTRSVRTRNHLIYNCINTISSSEIGRLLHVKSKNYNPPQASGFIEQYLHDAKSRILEQLARYPPQIRNNNNSTFNQTVHRLISDSSIVIKPDKNLGTVIVSRDWHETWVR